MNNKPNDTEKEFFQSRFDDFASEPTESAWKNVQKTLEQPTWGYTLFWNGKLFILNSVLVVLLCLGGLTRSETEAPGSTRISKIDTQISSVKENKEYKASQKAGIQVDTMLQAEHMVSKQEAHTGYITDRKRDTSEQIHSGTTVIQDEEPVRKADLQTTKHNNVDSNHQLNRNSQHDENTQRYHSNNLVTDSHSGRVQSGRKIKSTIAIDSATLSVSDDAASINKEVTNEDAAQKKSVQKNIPKMNAIESTIAKKRLADVSLNKGRSVKSNSHIVPSSTVQNPSSVPVRENSLVSAEPQQIWNEKIGSQGNIKDQTENIGNRQFHFSRLKHSLIVVQAGIMPVKTLQFPEIQPHNPMPIRRWSAYVSYTQSKSYYTISPVITDSIWVDQVKLGQSMSAQRTGWQWQAGVSYIYTQRIHLRGGFFYYKQEQQLQYNSRSLYPTSTSVRMDSSTGITLIPIYKKDAYERKTIQQNIGLRLDVLYQLGVFNRFRHYASAGIQTAIRRNNERSTGIQTDIQIGYGIARSLSSRLECWIEPGFRYSLNTYSDPLRYMRIHPYYFGISAGFQLKL